MPSVIAPSTGGSGYGEPGRRSVRVAPTALVGEVVHVRGTLPGAAHRRIVLQRLDPRRGWRNVARARVRSTQRYLIGWRPDRSGRISLRVALAKPASAHAAQAAPVAVVNVYRPAMATFFGPGLYGNATYCGQVLTAVLHGVAHRRLPCGTLVAIVYERREIVVPVVDRGPFAAGYDWDLTQATADALGFTASGAIGYARVVAPAPH
jgi:rare lipoprotein A (peptidoglycan hydrolase)